MNLLLMGFLLFISGLCLWIAIRPSVDLEQAALLPFADDPQAAERVQLETGKQCNHVVSVPFEPLETTAEFHLKA